MICDDPVVSYLAEFGFNVIRLPRTGIAPGLVLAGKGPMLNRISDLGKVWKSKEKAPRPLPKSRAAMLDGKRTRQFDSKTGFSIAEQVLKPVGLDLPKLKLALAGANTFEFGFGDSEIWSVDPIDVGAYLAKGSLDEANPVVQHYIVKDRPPIHVILDVLLSASVSIQVSQKRDGALDLDLGALRKAVDVKVEVESKSERSTRLLFKGDTQLAFGFRALKLTYENGEWKVHGQAKPGSVFHARPPHPSQWASMFPLGEAEVVDQADPWLPSS